MIREQIAYKYHQARNNNVWPADFADTILALPNGLEAVKECEGYWVHDKTCSCHGTGEIVRDLTVGEANEIPIMLLDGRAKFEDKLHCDNAIVTQQRYIILPSGERVRVKKME